MKRLTLLLLLILMSVFVLVPATLAQPLNDVNGHWAEEHVKLLVNGAIITGYPDGSFRPEAFITREEFIKCLIEVQGTPLYASVSPSYSDVGMTDWSYPYIETAVESGILLPEEVNNNSLKPGEPISRIELTRLMVRVLKLPLQSDYTGFDDGINIPAKLRGYVRAVKDHNLMAGYPDGTFRPWNPVTRAEASTILVRLIYKLGKGMGMVTICYDHGEGSVYKNAFPLHQRYGYPGVNYILPPHVGDPGMMTIEQLKAMELAGWETGSHSKNHMHFKDLSDGEIRKQLELPKAWLQENGLKYASFAYPFWFSNEPYPVVSEYCDSAVTSFGKSINESPINRYKLERFMFDAGLTDSEIINLLDQAVTKEGWVIFYTHSVLKDDEVPVNHGINQQRLEHLFQKIKERNLKVVTVSEGLVFKEALK